MSEPQTSSLGLLARLSDTLDSLPPSAVPDRGSWFRAAMLGHIAAELVRLGRADVWNAALARAVEYDAGMRGSAEVSA